MRSFGSRPRPPYLRILSLAAIMALAGCQSQAEKLKAGLVPVKGTILVGETPPEGALITFHPDESKGNTARVMAMGKVGKDGIYELVSGANPGASPGWYRVTLTSFGAPSSKAPRINLRYTRLENTPLMVEVVAEPRAGQYDLRLIK